MDIGIWEGLALVAMTALGGGGVYGQQKVKEYRNGNGNGNGKTGKYMTIAEHERLCPARFKEVHSKLDDMHADIKDLKK